MLILDRGVKCQAVLSKTLIEETINQILLHYIIIIIIIIIIFNYILILHWFKHYLLKDNSLSLLFL